MKHRKALSLFCLIMYMIIMVVPSFARASDQIRDYTIDITTSSGWIDIEFEVTGKQPMSSLGCESIYVYERVGNSWSLEESFFEDDDGMSRTNASRCSNLISVRCRSEEHTSELQSL